jgi:uncharacterized membrane protein (UPF0182 family)
VAILVYLYTVFAGVWTDHLWFESIGFHQVFSTMLLTQIGLFVVSALIMGAIVALNLWLCLRSAPVATPRKSTNAQETFQGWTGWRRRAAIIAPAVILAILAGLSWIPNASVFLAWANQEPFGQTDARFGIDISFYVFSYPWYRILVNSFEVSMVLSAVLIVIGYFLSGSLFADIGGGKRGTTKAARVHLSILLGLITLGYAATELLNRYGVLLKDGSLLDGLTYTGNHAQVNAYLILAVIAALTAVLFFATAFGQTWRLPIISVILVVASSIIIGMIYPAIIQAFTVNPTEPDKERPYMEMNIAATRQAYGIDDVAVADYSAVTSTAAGQLKSDAEALPGIRLIDPQMVQDTFEQLQQVRGFYSFSPVLDVDRYVIDGTETDVVLAAREMDHTGLADDQRNWNNLHTVYTHGYGLVAAYGNRRQADGSPEWLASDIPTTGPLTAEQPRIYYGEMSTDYAIVGRGEGQDPIEFDTPGGGSTSGEQYNTYDGSGGVAIGSFINRALYATRFGSINMLLSDRVGQDSKILYDRTPKQRVAAVAPWLTTDSDTYPAIVDGRIVWIVDGYTTSDAYPNGERVIAADAISDSLTNPNASLNLNPRINYIRNAVKAVVDAYDGSVKLYAWDEDDPVLKTWMKVFPGTVEPKSAISDELMAHLRYPEDLFKIQRAILARYHMTDPGAWYNQSDLWKVPAYPVEQKSTGASTKEPTYYLSIKWPAADVDGEEMAGDDSPLFSQTSVYTPNKRDNLSAYMSVVAEATSDQYGQIRVLRMSDTQQIDGPGQAYNAMIADESVSSVLLPYSSSGSSSTAKQGNLLTIPLGGGLLYVEPIYTQQATGNTAYPILRFVVVRFGSNVGVGSTLQEALDQVFGGDAGATTGENEVDGADPGDGSGVDQGPATTPGTPSEVAQAALSQAESSFQAAEDALRSGDLAGYQKANEQAKQAVQQALEAMGQ